MYISLFILIMTGKMKMDRRKFIVSAAGVIAASSASENLLESLAAQQPGNRPNILLINTDDQPSWWVGAYGNKDIHTPNMDRLAREGMLFRTCVTVPVCSPSRAMLLTGRYNNQVGIDDFINNDEAVGLPSALFHDRVAAAFGILHDRLFPAIETPFQPGHVSSKGLDLVRHFLQGTVAVDNNAAAGKEIPDAFLDILVAHGQGQPFLVLAVRLLARLLRSNLELQSIRVVPNTFRQVKFSSNIPL